MAEKSPTSDKIRLQNVRLSFLKIEKPEAYEQGQKEKYQCTALLDPSNPQHAESIKLLEATAAQLCGDAYGGIPDDIKMERHQRLPCGYAAKHPKKKDYTGYENMYYVVLANTIKPAIADRLGNSVLPGEPQFPYSGCYGNVNLSMWALTGPMANKHGNMIRCNFIGVQFVRDGEAFGAAPPSAEEEFEALEDNGPAVEAGAAAPADDPFGSGAPSGESDPFNF